MWLLLASGVLALAACVGPIPMPLAPTPSARPVVSASPPPAALVPEVGHVRVAVGDWKYIDVPGAVRAVVSEGDRVVAIRGGEAHQAITIEGLAAGEAMILASDGEGRQIQIAVDVVLGRDGPCSTRSVPVLGLAITQEQKVERWQKSGNGAGELLVEEETAVTFDRAGVLLTQSWGFDGRRQCTLYVADDSLSCPSTATVAVGPEIRFPLTGSKPKWRLVGRGIAKVTAASSERSLTIVGTKPGRAALWTRDAKKEWSCTLLDVTP